MIKKFPIYLLMAIFVNLIVLGAFIFIGSLVLRGHINSSYLYDFNKMSAIGAVLGGTLSPLLSFVTFIFIFMNYHEEKASKEEALFIETFYRLVDRLNNRLLSISQYTTDKSAKGNNHIYTGVNLLDKYIKLYRTDNNYSVDIEIQTDKIKGFGKDYMNILKQLDKPLVDIDRNQRDIMVTYLKVTLPEEFFTLMNLFSQSKRNTHWFKDELFTLNKKFIVDDEVSRIKKSK